MSLDQQITIFGYLGQANNPFWTSLVQQMTIFGYLGPANIHLWPVNDRFKRVIIIFVHLDRLVTIVGQFG